MRYQPRDWTELSEGDAQGFAEEAAECADGRGGGSGAAWVVDTEAAEDEAVVVAFIPTEVAGIVATDMAQRVAVLMGLGEPTDTAERNAEPITPEEAKTLHAVWAGDHFDPAHLETVQPKLEAIAGESWR